MPTDGLVAVDGRTGEPKGEPTDEPTGSCLPLYEHAVVLGGEGPPGDQ